MRSLASILIGEGLAVPILLIEASLFQLSCFTCNYFVIARAPDILRESCWDCGRYGRTECIIIHITS